MTDRNTNAHAAKQWGRRLAPWLLGGVVVAGGYFLAMQYAQSSIEARLSTMTERKVTLERVWFNPLTATLTLNSLHIPGSDADRRPVIAAEVATFNLTYASLWNDGFHIERVDLEAPQLELETKPSGALNLSTLFAHGERGGEASSFQVDVLNVDNGQLAWTFPTPAGPSRVALDSVSITAKGFNSARKQPFDLQGAGRLESGTLAGHGKMGFMPWSTSLWLDFDQIPANAYQTAMSYMTGATVTQGTLNGELHLIDGEKGLSLAGDLSLASAVLVDDAQAPLVKAKSVRLSGLEFDQSTSKMSADSLVLDAPWILAEITPQSSFNLSALMPSARKTASDHDQKRDGAAEGEQVNTEQVKNEQASNEQEQKQNREGGIRLKTLRWEDGTIELKDRHLKEPFEVTLDQLHGQLNDIDSRDAKPLSVEMTGQVSSSSPLSLKGELALFDAPRSGKVELSIKSMPVAEFAPYVREFGGYEVKQGQVSATMHYRLDGETIRSSNTIYFNDLALGQPVGKPPSFPIKTAIALLEDDQGRLTLSVPFTLSANEASVDISALVWQALRKAFADVLTSPFDALSALVSDSSSAKASGRGPTSLYQAIGHSTVEQNGRTIKIRFGHQEYRLNEAKADRLTHWARGLAKRSKLAVRLTPGVSRGERSSLDDRQVRALLDDRRATLKALLSDAGVKSYQIKERDGGASQLTTLELISR
ncbi:DUF748 domain-containing protein [Larsenimonas suaedae]|uniref:DUF748 domain-containing protein n=1 Tax=Larsenimonas suaedae TaxID=1851019 RepID=A0ABU1GUM8_9GAMM|nr:DUF748 domain-containing protein [Larsenimonas suaedae]MCM2971740.1 DUF748 domain-containing protein [Larsenimonas suaedae]MDR5895292.1 DUF748 domain-containing protein [Larsenimonas suaedae]